MFATYHLADTPLSLFVLVNWFFCLFTAVWLLCLVLTARHQFLKPSMFLLLVTHVLFQWPAAIFSGFIEGFLPDPWVLPIALHSYMLIGIFISSLTFSEYTKKLWDEITGGEFRQAIISKTALKFLFGYIVVVLLIYFYSVPPWHTGLYALIYDPTASDMARFRSFHDLPPTVKYLFSFMQDAAAPLLAAFLALALAKMLSQKNYFRAAQIVGFIIFVLLSVSLTGARYHAGKIVLVMSVVLMLKRGDRLSTVKCLLALLCFLVPPALITLIREGHSITPAAIAEYLVFGVLLHRVLIVPLQVGIWHLQYAQLAGEFGIGAVPKLAVLLGEIPLHVPTMIGQYYNYNSTVETHADAGYLLSYVSYFGFSGVIVSLGCLFFLDVALLVYRRLSPHLRLPCIAAINITTLEFVQSDYTTVFISHGFGIILLFAWLIEQLSRVPKIDAPSAASFK